MAFVGTFEHLFPGSDVILKDYTTSKNTFGLEIVGLPLPLFIDSKRERLTTPKSAFYPRSAFDHKAVEQSGSRAGTYLAVRA